MRKPYILFQTDFGVGGGASMYGMCKLVDPALRSEELSHSVPTFDVAEATRRLSVVMPHWPKGTIFVSVVDPGVGTPRRACIARTANMFYVVTPDNGTLSEVQKRFGITEIREIDETINRYPHTPKVSIFHGRDLFAYCAARLASGLITYEQVGPAYPLDEIIGGNGNTTVTVAEPEEDNKYDAAKTPASIVIFNDFNHDGRMAVMRGICRKVHFNVDVYDLPLSPTERMEDMLAEMLPHWPERTVFVNAVGLTPYNNIDPTLFEGDRVLMTPASVSSKGKQDLVVNPEEMLTHLALAAAMRV